jgi:hypothetical protein
MYETSRRDPFIISATSLLPRTQEITRSLIRAIKALEPYVFASILLIMNVEHTLRRSFTAISGNTIWLDAGGDANPARIRGVEGNECDCANGHFGGSPGWYHLHCVPFRSLLYLSPRVRIVRLPCGGARDYTSCSATLLTSSNPASCSSRFRRYPNLPFRSYCSEIYDGTSKAHQYRAAGSRTG